MNFNFKFRRGGWMRGKRGGPFGGGGPFGEDGPFGEGGPFGKGGPFGHHGPFGKHGRQRHRRGDIRIVLLQLIAEAPRHGYELIKLVEERNSGFYRPSPGVIYPTLQLLEDEGNLTSEMVEGKRVYTITEAGRTLLAQTEQDDEKWEKPFGKGKNEHLPELRHKAMAFFESVMQVARYGTPEQLKAVQAILTKATQDVHAILAGGGDTPRQV